MADMGQPHVPCGHMSTPLPGQIRCPTCHRSTPPAGFCTQCGTAIPASARARPRGLDRAELQDRIRVHRPGDAAFRRGSTVGEGHAQAPSPYQPFRPEPEDGLVIPAAEAGEDGAVHVDNTPPGFDDRTPPIVVPPPVIEPPPHLPARPAPTFTPPPAAVAGLPAAIPVPPLAVVQPPAVAPFPAMAAEQRAPGARPRRIVKAEAPPPQWTAPDQPYEPPEEYDYGSRPPNDDWGRRGSGMSPLAIGGFVLLGVLAIAVGAFISGIFSGGVAQATPTPTPTQSVAPSATLQPTQGPSAGASAAGSPGATSNGSPVAFPDGFTARTQPCAEQPSSQDGCDSSGATVTGGSVWVWVGWRKGNDADVLSVTVLDAAGTSAGDGSLALGSIKCGNSCSGWGYFRFPGLAVGNYTIRVNRNDQFAAQATFTVTS